MGTLGYWFESSLVGYKNREVAQLVRAHVFYTNRYLANLVPINYGIGPWGCRFESYLPGYKNLSLNALSSSGLGQSGLNR